MAKELYVVSVSLAIQVTPAATFAVKMPGWRQFQELNRSEMEVLLKFSRPACVDEVFDDLAQEWEIERAELDGLVESMIAQGILVRPDGPEELSRLQLFRRAATEHLARERSGLFPLRSPFEHQQPDLYYPGLSTREVHDRERFAWTAGLEAAAPAILAELDGLLASRQGFSEVYKQHTSTGSWAAAYFWVFGKRMDATCGACPETARLLETIPGVTTFSTALFSALAPGTNVLPHCGLTNAKLRCQLPLRVPEQCGLRIADREVRLEVGRCVVFDDSFLHSAWNMSSQPRFVLLFDFFHPDLAPAEIELLLEVSAAAKTQSGYMQQVQPARSPAWVYG